MWGPFDDFKTAKIISDSLSNATLDDIINYVESNENIEQHLLTTTADAGNHSLHQYFLGKNR